MNQPLVSIGIPTYNRPEGLINTLKSIINQTYKNIEIIVSDNASTDKRNIDVIKKYAKKYKRIQPYFQIENKGALFNFKYVLSKAKGNYFMLAADDDTISHNFIDEAVKYFQNNTKYSVVSATPYAVNGDTKKRIYGVTIENKLSIFRAINSYNYMLVSYFYGLIRISDLLKIKIENRFAEDRYVDASLAFLGKIKTLPNCGLYRGPGDSSSSDPIDSHKKMMKNLDIPFKGLFNSRVIMAKNAYKDVFYQNKVYLELNNVRKIILGIMCFINTLKTSIIFYYIILPLKKIRSLLKRRLRLILKPVYFLKKAIYKLHKSNKIAIWGWWNGNNLGDNWIKECMKKCFKKVTFLHSEGIDDLNKYKFVICGGGGLFINDVPDKWRNIETKFGAIGLGAEFKHNNNSAINLEKKSEFYFVRDSHSIDCMNLSLNNKSYDITFSYPLQYKKVLKNDIVLLIWREPGKLYHNKMFEKYIGEITRKDEWINVLKEEFNYIVEDSFKTKKYYIDKLTKKVGFIVSGRYHGIIAAIQRGIPCIAIDICPKIRALMDECGLNDYCLKIGDISKLSNTIEKAKKCKEIIRKMQKDFTLKANITVSRHIKIANEVINKLI